MLRLAGDEHFFLFFLFDGGEEKKFYDIDYNLLSRAAVTKKKCYLISAPGLKLL
jgi:hypothetical protein